MTWGASVCRWLAAKLGRWADWLDPPPPPAPPPDRSELLTTACVLVAYAKGTWPHASGEFKRHQVLARLMKAFPSERQRVIARAIEDALDLEG